MKTIVAGLLLLVAGTTCVAAQNAPELRVRAAKVKVADLDKGLAFYRDVLGLKVMEKGQDHALLDGVSMPLILEKTERERAGRFLEESQTILVFQTSDIRSTMDRMLERGVEIVEEPAPYGINRETGKPLGLSAKFRDPSSTVHSIVEQQVDGEVFEGIRIYNIGFYLPDIDAARDIYCATLGFVALTEKYLPTAIPLGHGDMSFAFMLHYRDGLGHAAVDYPGDAQSMIVYESSDLDATTAHLRGRGIELLHEYPHSRPGERFIAFRDRFGNTSEIVERLLQGSSK